MSERGRVIYVAAHDGGCEGYSLPILAFEDRDTALRWAAGQADAYDIAAVPVHPDVPIKPWFHVEPEKLPSTLPDAETAEPG